MKCVYERRRVACGVSVAVVIITRFIVIYQQRRAFLFKYS